MHTWVEIQAEHGRGCVQVVSVGNPWGSPAKELGGKSVGPEALHLSFDGD